MMFLSWNRPSSKQQKDCIMKSGSFNYASKHIGSTAKHVSSLQEDEDLLKDVSSLTILVFWLVLAMKPTKRENLHFNLGGILVSNWTFVDPKTQIQNGNKFCVCAKEFVPWLMMPLQVVYVKEKHINQNKSSISSFGFGSGTLHGHLLAGEKRFTIELDENNQVWYEVLSFSKPAHILSMIGYPYAGMRQKYFNHQSTTAVKKCCLST